VLRKPERCCLTGRADLRVLAAWRVLRLRDSQKSANHFAQDDRVGVVRERAVGFADAHPNDDKAVARMGHPDCAASGIFLCVLVVPRGFGGIAGFWGGGR